MTEVNMGDEVITTDLPPEAVADLQQPAGQPEEPAKEPEKATEQPVEATKEPEKPAEAADDKTEQPTDRFTSKKPTPIQNLLEKKHEAEERAAQAEAKAQELEAKLAQLSQAPASPQTTDKIQALAEKHGIDAEILADIVATARDGLSPELPQEVKDLIEKSKADELQKAEITAFNKRVDSLATTLKDDLLKDPQVREKLQALAYSTEKAPDGEPYYQKEIAELYFAFVKPEVEPGRVTAETPRGNSGSDILDFEEIHNDEARLEEFARTASSEQFQAYTKWRDSKQGDVPIRRKTIS